MNRRQRERDHRRASARASPAASREHEAHTAQGCGKLQKPTRRRRPRWRHATPAPDVEMATSRRGDRGCMALVLGTHGRAVHVSSRAFEDGAGTNPEELIGARREAGLLQRIAAVRRRCGGRARPGLGGDPRRGVHLRQDRRASRRSRRSNLVTRAPRTPAVGPRRPSSRPRNAAKEGCIMLPRASDGVGDHSERGRSDWRADRPAGRCATTRTAAAEPPNVGDAGQRDMRPLSRWWDR
jgi:hypothetical protein